ncbi:hypothetical protein OZX61_12740 (plasmid) [Acinetobacter sp. ESL0695]|uniref:hypothetical protein n=1 Tax=Acinetobacter sp. ESL0695 TaxID=2983215 RepID=UPI0023F2FD69|nr:hypothetical protein [Acinetobacter sp. ESL0695]WEV50209.1 hypothetical protein OZX61_12740 [Acinetobacter sp. ESL0695]
MNILKTKGIKPSLKSPIKMMIFIFIFILITIWLSKLGSKFYEEADEEATQSAISKVIPRMNRLASEGKEDAILWMADMQSNGATAKYFNGYPSYNQQLDTLVNNNNSRALFLKAKIIYSTNKASAIELAKRSSNQGNFDALLFLHEKFKTGELKDLNFKTGELKNLDLEYLK